MIHGLILTLNILGWVLLTLAAAGTVYGALACWTLRRFFARPMSAPTSHHGMTLLKPLHGAEPRLSANLASFLDQRHEGPLQMVCGVGDANDDAALAVNSLKAAHPHADITLTVAGPIPAANRKVANLIGMMPAVRHDLLVLSDSDMVADRDYLARIASVLDQPGVGAVTCLYRGRGDAGFWSVLGAAGLSWQFLPGALFGVTHKLARPTMGSTIAIHTQTLTSIGGFEAFRDTLADDYAVGAAVRAKGLSVVVPPMLVTHASSERSLGDLWRHELRWSATVRGVAPGAFVGSVIALPLALAMLGLALTGGAMAGWAILLAALAMRVATIDGVDRAAGEPTAPLWLLPLRDLFSLAIYLATFAVHSVDWRGAQLTLEGDGRIAATRRQD